MADESTIKIRCSKCMLSFSVPIRFFDERIAASLPIYCPEGHRLGISQGIDRTPVIEPAFKDRCIWCGRTMADHLDKPHPRLGPDVRIRCGGLKANFKAGTVRHG